jgi:glycerophosphoryl diester phosphodiesterase
MPRSLIIAHRGGAALKTENSLPAFENAVRLGADGVECDVQCTSDGEVVVFHDETLDRLCGEPGCLRDITFRDLRKNFRLPGGEVIPHFEEFCEVAAAGNAMVFVEIKDFAAVDKVKRLLPRHLPPEQCVVGSFCMQTTRCLLENPHGRVLQLVRHSDNFFTPELINDCEVVGLPSGAVSEESVRFLQRELHREVWAWTLNEASEIRQALVLGVDGIITDRPDLALQLRKD